jgi:anti-repressor protein
MNELIKITINEQQEQIVSARDLHEFLEIKTKFADWIKNSINDFDFIKDQDFCTLSKNLENGGKSKEYHLKLDMAKELSMLARNEKGKQARKYFIECEKQLYQPKQLSRMDILTIAIESEKEVLKLKAESEKQQKQIITQKPKVDFFNDAMNSQTLIDLNDVAKTLLIKDESGKILGRNLLYQKLRDMAVLNANNKPYQSFINSKHFKLVERSYNHPKTGETILYFKTLLTQKGVTYLHKKFKLTD